MIQKNCSSRVHKLSEPWRRMLPNQLLSPSQRERQSRKVLLLPRQGRKQVESQRQIPNRSFCSLLRARNYPQESIHIAVRSESTSAHEDADSFPVVNSGERYISVRRQIRQTQQQAGAVLSSAVTENTRHTGHTGSVTIFAGSMDFINIRIIQGHFEPTRSYLSFTRSTRWYREV